MRRKRPELLRDPDLTYERVSNDAGDDSAEAAVIDATFDAEVEAALLGLPEKFRTVIELVDLNQLSYQEAADVLGIPVGTVMSRLHRARQRIPSASRETRCRGQGGRR